MSFDGWSGHESLTEVAAIVLEGEESFSVLRDAPGWGTQR